jgi:hypothetical protein
VLMLLDKYLMFVEVCLHKNKYSEFSIQLAAEY